MKHKVFFINIENKPLEHLCSGTEEIEKNDSSVWLDYFRWFQMAVTDEILVEMRNEKTLDNISKKVL